MACRKFNYLWPVKFITYSLLFTMLFSLYAKLQVCLKFLINQEYYAKVLCEKKTVKNSCCAGKCAMEKELNNISENEQKQAGAEQNRFLKFNKSSEALCQRHVLVNVVSCLGTITTAFHNGLCSGALNVLYRPPQAKINLFLHLA